MDNNQTDSQKPFYLCMLLVFTVLLINLLSAYIRHSEAGIGCTPTTNCYGEIGYHLQPETGEQIASAALAPVQNAKRLHRTIAIVLVLLVFGVVYQARQRPVEPATGTVLRIAPYLLIGLVLLLSSIGPISYMKTRPLIATTNLVGGMALLGIAWWLSLAVPARQQIEVSRGFARLTLVAFGLLIVQIGLGGWASANFAGDICFNTFNCVDEMTIGQTGESGFWPLRSLAVDDGGNIIMSQAQAHIQLAHRLVAVFATLALSVLGVQAIRGPLRSGGTCLLALLVLQLCLGITTQVSGLSLPVVVGHNLLAALLLMMVVRFYVLTGTNKQRAGVA